MRGGGEIQESCGLLNAFRLFMKTFKKKKKIIFHVQQSFSDNDANMVELKILGDRQREGSLLPDYRK